MFRKLYSQFPVQAYQHWDFIKGKYRGIFWGFKQLLILPILLKYYYWAEFYVNNIDINILITFAWGMPASGQQ